MKIRIIHFFRKDSQQQLQFIRIWNKASFHRNQQNHLFSYIPLSLQKIRKIFIEKDWSGCLLFVEGTAIAGAILSREEHAKTAHISYLCVLPEYQNRGFARKLLEAIETDAGQKHLCNLTLHVYPKNKRAMKLYRRCGFSPVAIHGGSPGTLPVISMIKQLEKGKRNRFFIPYFYSWLKFHFLYRKDCSPRIWSRWLYEK